MDCPILYTKTENIMVVNCGHSFSYEGISQYLDITPNFNCPLCKKKIFTIAPNWELRNIILDNNKKNNNNYTEPTNLCNIYFNFFNIHNRIINNQEEYTHLEFVLVCIFSLLCIYDYIRLIGNHLYIIPNNLISLFILLIYVCFYFLYLFAILYQAVNKKNFKYMLILYIFIKSIPIYNLIVYLFYHPSEYYILHLSNFNHINNNINYNLYYYFNYLR